MSNLSPGQIRNVVLVGHGGTGKTTLTESLLHLTGVIVRKGRVEDGTTVADFEPEEIKRRISVSMAIAPLTWGEHKVNLIDTPGFVDFIGEVELALDVADLAVLVVSAVEGVEVQTEAVWHLAAGAACPGSSSSTSSTGSVPTSPARSTGCAKPSAAASRHSSCRSARSRPSMASSTCWLTRPISYDAGKPSTGTVPAEMVELEVRVRDNLIEGIVVADDALMVRYLEGDIPAPTELAGALAVGVAAGAVFPVLCGSALDGVGLDRLLDLICAIPPRRRVQGAGGRPVHRGHR